MARTAAQLKRKASPEPRLVVTRRSLPVPNSEEESTDSDESSDGDWDKEYIIEKIVDVRASQTGLEFLVHWEGYKEKDRTWEPEHAVKHCDLRHLKEKIGEERARLRRHNFTVSSSSAKRRQRDSDSGSDLESGALSMQQLDERKKEAKRKKTASASSSTGPSSHASRAIENVANKYMAKNVKKTDRSVTFEKGDPDLEVTGRKSWNSQSALAVLSKPVPPPPPVSARPRKRSPSPRLKESKHSDHNTEEDEDEDEVVSKTPRMSANATPSVSLAKLPSFKKQPTSIPLPPPPSTSNAAPPKEQTSLSKPPESSLTVNPEPPSIPTAIPTTLPSNPSPSNGSTLTSVRRLRVSQSVAGPFSFLPSKSAPSTSNGASESAPPANSGLSIKGFSNSVSASSDPRLRRPRDESLDREPSLPAQAAPREISAAAQSEPGTGSAVSLFELERKLKVSPFYKNHLELFQSKSLATACLQGLQMDASLAMRCANTFCSIIHSATTGDLLDGENQALGVLLLLLRARTPLKVGDIGIIFIHRDQSFDALAPSLVELMDRRPPVEIYAFGGAQPVTAIFTQGYMVIPTANALSQSAEFERFIRYKNERTHIQVSVHPASVVILHRSGENHAVQAIQDKLAADTLSIVGLPHLGQGSPYLSLNLHPGDLARRPAPADGFEAENIPRVLMSIRGTKSVNLRRFIYVHSRVIARQAEELRRVGIEMLTWAQLTEKIEESVF